MTALTQESDPGQSNGGSSNQVSGSSNTESTTTSSGSSQASWRDTLPDDLKSNATLALYTDIPSLAKAHIHAQSLVGKKGVFPPGEKATEEEYQSFYKALGLPDADKYEVKVPEGKKVDDNLMKGLKEVAHKNGILPKQFQPLIEQYLKHEEESFSSYREQAKANTEKQLGKLKEEFGEGYDKQISFAKAAVKDLGDEFAQHLDRTGMGNDPWVIKAMAKLGKVLVGEDGIKGNGGGKFGQTPDEIQSEINKIRGDLKHPYYDSTHAGHKLAVQQMETLYKKLHG